MARPNVYMRCSKQLSKPICIVQTCVLSLYKRSRIVCHARLLFVCCVLVVCLRSVIVYVFVCNDLMCLMCRCYVFVDALDVLSAGAWPRHPCIVYYRCSLWVSCLFVYSLCLASFMAICVYHACSCVSCLGQAICVSVRLRTRPSTSSSCVCVCACVYVCMYVCMYVRMHVCMNVCMYV